MATSTSSRKNINSCTNSFKARIGKAKMRGVKWKSHVFTRDIIIYACAIAFPRAVSENNAISLNRDNSGSIDPIPKLSIPLNSEKYSEFNGIHAKM